MCPRWVPIRRCKVPGKIQYLKGASRCRCAAGMPGEGFEPPTFGLQNRCTTTVLTRQGIVFTAFSVQRSDQELDLMVEHVQLLSAAPS